MTYQLTINFNQGDIQMLLAGGYRIWVAQSVTNFPVVSGTLPIGWVSCQPIFLANIITWSDYYMVYETSSPQNAGVVIGLDAVAAAQPNMLYTYQNSAFTQGIGRSADYFDVSNNQADDSLHFGLAQQAVANGHILVAPVCAAPVLFGQTGSFMPSVTFSVFLSNTIHGEAGVVLSEIPANACVVTLSPQTSATLIYNTGTVTLSVSN